MKWLFRLSCGSETQILKARGWDRDRLTGGRDGVRWMASARRGVPRPRRSDVRIDQGGPDWAAKGSWRPVRTWRRSTLGGASFTHTGSGRAPIIREAKTLPATSPFPRGAMALTLALTCSLGPTVPHAQTPASSTPLVPVLEPL